MTANTNPALVYAEIKDAYLRYIDTAFWLRSDELMRERRERLADSDLLFTDVLLEPVLPYEATDVLAEVVEQIGLDPRVTRLVGEALFGDYTTPGEPYRLRSHQAQALRQSLQPGASPKRNVVVTSGTGSGKTESFLLPVLARLVAESLTWAKDGGWPPVVGGLVGPVAKQPFEDNSTGSHPCPRPLPDERTRRRPDHTPTQGRPGHSRPAGRTSVVVRPLHGSDARGRRSAELGQGRQGQGGLGPDPGHGR